MSDDKLIETMTDSQLSFWRKERPDAPIDAWTRDYARSHARQFVHMMRAYEAATSKPVEG